ncbi:guanine nucleotide-binding protein G(I)/G(S)/G(O) subunit gamma-7-like [Actinia tenebrosa]|uniref:Guanine nucleotide-binding protein subunit gamma n=1 Tax=Actinia tenebrosa TaxID=6105 RepID=A0A6P8JEE8_ACTTE|nr:guanine nucleotide-binding protein G(I)/G(S)/G(O) subunit gamma-7-like [Actinia tenebrosa]
MYSSAKKESEIQNQQRIISQLKRECKVERMKVSHAASELMHYCEEKQLQDPFLLKIPANENPFKERRSGCLVL